MLTDFVHRTAGDCIYVLCRPAVDPRDLLPACLVDQVTPDVLVKAYRLRALAHQAALGTSRGGFYHQVCVASVLTGSGDAARPEYAGKHWNYVMWNDRRESLEGNLETGHRKRIAEIVEDYALPRPAETHAFGTPDDLVRVRVSRLGRFLLGIDAELGLPAEAAALPAYSGVAAVREDLKDDGWRSTITAYPVSQLRYWCTRSATVTLEVGSSDDLYDFEALEVLRGAEVLAAWMSGVSWTLRPVAPQVIVEPRTSSAT